MVPEFSIYGIYIAAAPAYACLALLIAIVIHRLLVKLRVYRFVWHPVLFDTALFTIVWALLTLFPPPLPTGILP